MDMWLKREKKTRAKLFSTFVCVCVFQRTVGTVCFLQILKHDAYKWNERRKNWQKGAKSLSHTRPIYSRLLQSNSFLFLFISYVDPEGTISAVRCSEKITPVHEKNFSNPRSSQNLTRYKTKRIFSCPKFWWQKKTVNYDTPLPFKDIQTLKFLHAGS